MDYINVFLVSVGGSASLLAIAGYAVKSYISFQLTKEMEAYKAKNNLDIEEVKANLQVMVANDIKDREFQYVMKKYEGPLLYAVYDLQSRLYNIIEQGFITRFYLQGSDNEKDYVINNTVFVIAQYFAWVEIIRQEIQFIEFKDIKRTKEISRLRDRIYGLWQSSEFDDLFRIWAGEQRAIGELMIVERNNQLVCIGYSSFLTCLTNNNEPLLEKLKSDVKYLTNSEEESFSRLTEIQHTLIKTLNYLDPDNIRFPEECRSFVPKL